MTSSRLLSLREPVPQEPVGVLVGAPLPRLVGVAEADGRARALLQARGARELASAVDRDGAHHHPGEGAHGGPSHLGARLVGRLAAHEVAGPPVDLRHQARPALAAGDGVPLPVPDAGPARHDGRALEHLVRDVRPVRALGLARRVAPPAVVPEEAPRRPPGISRSRSPLAIARHVVVSLTERTGSSLASLPATCSGDHFSSRTRRATSALVPGSSSRCGLRHLALFCAVEAR